MALFYFLILIFIVKLNFISHYSIRNFYSTLKIFNHQSVNFVRILVFIVRTTLILEARCLNYFVFNQINYLAYYSYFIDLIIYRIFNWYLFEGWVLI